MRRRAENSKTPKEEEGLGREGNGSSTLKWRRRGETEKRKE